MRASGHCYRTSACTAPAIQLFAGIFGRPLTWADLPWLRSLTKLPLILKGICHPDDARRAIDAGADAIYCSKSRRKASERRRGGH